MPSVRDHMNPDVLSVPADGTLAEAAQLMVERNVGSAVVLDTGGQLSGIITERDALRAVARGRVPWSTSVRDVMTPDPRVAAPDDDSESALAAMVEGGFRHLPVVEDGRVIGIVGMRDFVRSPAADGVEAASGS